MIWAAAVAATTDSYVPPVTAGPERESLSRDLFLVSVAITTGEHE
jgi:hypothetical protein